MKDASAEGCTEEGEQENPLRSRLGAPQQYTADFDSENGRLKVHCDAKVEIPSVEQVSTYRVSQSDMTSEQMDAAGRDAISWNPRTSMSSLTEEEALSLAGITQQEARELAKEKVAELGIPGMEEALVQLGIHTDLHGDEFTTDNAGWLVNFTRTIDGIPVTYTGEQGGAYEDMESEFDTWGYEWLQVAVNRDGIQMAQCYNIYDIGERTTENVQLISFDEVSQIFRQMILMQSADLDSETREYQIDRITFGYTRIYDPATDSRSGVLVPAWDFFGSYREKAEYEGESVEYISDSADMSHLTINAIDGSIIDRSLGY